MTRLYLFAEGQTEQTFASNTLMEHLATKGVYLQNPVLIAHARKKGQVHRGGGRNYVPIKNDILRFLAQENGRDVFFTTMIDLYAIHKGFPGLEESEKLRSFPQQRVEFLEGSFAADIGDPRFIPYIQLHEYEAYLFSDPAMFHQFYDGHSKQIEELKAISRKHSSPELINDGQYTSPSKRIIRHLPDYEGAKRVVGPQVASLIGLDKIRSKCPHFAAWLSRLEALGGGNPSA